LVFLVTLNLFYKLTMRYLLVLVCCSLCCFQARTQTPDPDLFNQTWYLRSVYDSDLGQYLIVVEGYQPYSGNPTIPQIHPQVTIDPSLSFTGLGICNTFDGMLEYDGLNNGFRTISTNQTNMSCGFFENMDEPITIGPFGYVDPDPTFYTIINPQITDDPDGFQTLTYDTQPFVGYTYRNTPVLGNEDFTLKKISLYPNPSNNQIHINTGNTTVNSLVLRDLAGRKIYQWQPKSTEFSIEIHWLINGVYLLELDSAHSEAVFKIVKN